MEQAIAATPMHQRTLSALTIRYSARIPIDTMTKAQYSASTIKACAYLRSENSPWRVNSRHHRPSSANAKAAAEPCEVPAPKSLAPQNMIPRTTQAEKLPTSSSARAIEARYSSRSVPLSRADSATAAEMKTPACNGLKSD